MTLEIMKDLLLEKISLASHFTSDKLTTSTALQGILLQNKQGVLHLYSTNLNMFYHTSLKSDIEKDFQIIIEPKKIMEFLQFLQPGKVTLEIKDKQISLTQNKTKGNFPVLNSEDFPLPPEIKEKEQKIEAAFLSKNLPLILFTASNDDARPVLTGVNFVVSDEELLMVATDGFRLSIMKEKRKGDISSMIIPADFLQEVLRNIGSVKDVLFSYSQTEKTVCFKIENDSFYSRLIEGEYPAYDKVIPSDVKTTISLDKADFMRNIKLISIFARDFSNVVVCEFKKGELIMRPKKEGNEENTTIQEIDFTGEDQKIAFNFKYIIDFLNHVDAKKIVIEILRSDAPIVFKLDNNPSFIHIIMPVRITE